MKKLVMFVIVPVLIGGILCYGTAFAEHTGPGKYNNEDLEKFETPNKNAEKTAPECTQIRYLMRKRARMGKLRIKNTGAARGPLFNRTISDIKAEIDEILD